MQIHRAYALYSMDLLKSSCKLLPRRTLRDLYYTHTCPHLIGNFSVWDTAKSSKMYIKPLSTLQKMLITLICNVSPRTYTAHAPGESKNGCSLAYFSCLYWFNFARNSWKNFTPLLLNRILILSHNHKPCGHLKA